MAHKKILRNLQSFMHSAPKLNIFIDALNNELDIAISTINNVKSSIQIGTATGIYLDDIGKLFKLSRNLSETDTAYRQRLLTFWNGFVSSGTVADIQIAIANLLNVDSSTIVVNVIREMVFTLSVSINPSTDLTLLNNIHSILNSIKASGTYYGGANAISEGGIFQFNVSNYNSSDVLL